METNYEKKLCQGVEQQSNNLTYEVKDNLWKLKLNATLYHFGQQRYIF